MARPRKKEIDKQSKQLPSVRCTEQEYQRIHARCQELGMCVSVYLRQAALTRKIVVKKSQVDTELIFQLRKLGVNLNQQTKLLHQTKNVTPELNQLWLKITQLLDQLRMENK